MLASFWPRFHKIHLRCSGRKLISTPSLLLHDPILKSCFHQPFKLFNHFLNRFPSFSALNSSHTWVPSKSIIENIIFKLAYNPSPVPSCLCIRLFFGTPLTTSTKERWKKLTFNYRIDLFFLFYFFSVSWLNYIFYRIKYARITTTEPPRWFDEYCSRNTFQDVKQRALQE